jgi:diaminopimelate epimerase
MSAVGDTDANAASGGKLRATTRYYRGHGLGNDYLVFETMTGGEDASWGVTPSAVRKVCDRGTGVGSDGLLVLLGNHPERGEYEVRGFNPDGSEFERSGNGLRVLASYLVREMLVRRDSFQIRSGGCLLTLVVHESDTRGRYNISVEMGQALVGLDAVRANPAALDADGRAVHGTLGPIVFIPVSIGNPHAVVFPSQPADIDPDEIGSFLEHHAAFPRGVNVQVAEVLAPDVLRIAVWERGAGRTSASGTSACASAVAGVATGRLQPGWITVEMERGALRVSVTASLEVVLRGPVEEVSEGHLTSLFLRTLNESD